jgi:hypothetical protein
MAGRPIEITVQHQSAASSDSGSGLTLDSGSSIRISDMGIIGSSRMKRKKGWLADDNKFQE